MGKRTKKKDEEIVESMPCPFTNGIECPHAKNLTCSLDGVTGLAHLGYRAAYTLIAWWVLGMSISVGQSFFVSIVLFIAPLWLDCCKFSPRSKKRRILKNIESSFAVLFGLIGILGVMSCLEVQEINDSLFVVISSKHVLAGMFKVNVQHIWYALCSNFILTFVDWAANITAMEKKVLNETVGAKGV